MTAPKKIVILGAGIAGLSAAYFLSRTGRFSVTVLEKESVVGGLCGSFKHFDFTLDFGPHKIYSALPGVLDEIRAVMGDRLIKVRKQNRIFLKGRPLDYPLRLANLYQTLGWRVFLSLGWGYALALLRGLFKRSEPASYQDYMRRRFGDPTYDLILRPLAEKIWGQPETLHADIARMRVPASSGADIVLKLLGLKKETADSNAEFFYYPRDGFGGFPQRLKELIEEGGGKVFTDAHVQKFNQSGPAIAQVTVLRDGVLETLDCDYVISSIPLPALARLVCEKSDPLFPVAIERLKSRHLILVYLFLNKDLVLRDQWLFFPEREFLFSRISEQKQMNPALGPAGQTVLCCDFTCAEDVWAWEATDETLAQKCRDGLKQAGIISDGDVFGHLVKRIKNFYPRYDMRYSEKLDSVAASLKTVDNLIVTGRLGRYNYNNSDHCFDMARLISEQLHQGCAPRDIWDALQRRIGEYKIVD